MTRSFSMGMIATQNFEIFMIALALQRRNKNKKMEEKKNKTKPIMIENENGKGNGGENYYQKHFNKRYLSFCNGKMYNNQWYLVH